MPIITKMFFVLCHTKSVKSGVYFTARPHLDFVPLAPQRLVQLWGWGFGMTGPVWEAPSVARCQVPGLREKSLFPKFSFFKTRTLREEMLLWSYLSGIPAIRGKKVPFTTLGSVPGAHSSSVGCWAGGWGPLSAHLPLGVLGRLTR